MITTPLLYFYRLPDNYKLGLFFLAIAAVAGVLAYIFYCKDRKLILSEKKNDTDDAKEGDEKEVVTT